MLKVSKAISSVEHKLTLVPFITAGYPDIQKTKTILKILSQEGVAAIEVGIPYSDALADGIVIQESSRQALSQNVYINEVLQLIKDVSIDIKVPIIVFTYFNPVLSRGISTFIKKIADAGADGLIIPDLPVEESDYITLLCNYYNIELILFISPTSSDTRISQIIAKAPGCIYVVSDYGTTGIRDGLSTNVKALVKRIKNNTDKCIMLGFGISNTEQITEIINLNLSVDAIVMGTAFIRQIKHMYQTNNYKSIELFCRSINHTISK